MSFLVLPSNSSFYPLEIRWEGLFNGTAKLALPERFSTSPLGGEISLRHSWGECRPQDVWGLPFKNPEGACSQVSTGGSMPGAILTHSLLGTPPNLAHRCSSLSCMREIPETPILALLVRCGLVVTPVSVLERDKRFKRTQRRQVSRSLKEDLTLNTESLAPALPPK